MKTLHFFKSWSKALHVFLLMLLTAPLAVSAQETLTVYPDGTQTSTDVPICYFVATQLKCEFVIPASELGVMEEGTISKMSFHLSSTASGLESHTFQVFLREVDNPTISSYYGTTGATIVYEGSLSASQSTMDVTFTTNYTYHGGNLLVGVYKPGGNVSFASGMKFWGKTVSGACVQGDAFSEYGSVSCTQQNFIPRTTFTYSANNSSCPKPKNLTATDVAATSATLSWTQNGDADHWDVFYTDNPNYEPRSYTQPQFTNIDANPFTLNGLSSGCTYYAFVRVNCGDEVGDWSNPCMFSPECEQPSGLEVGNVTTQSATLSWTVSGGEQDWEIQYRKYDEVDYATVEEAITNPFTLQGLESSSGYVVRVRAVCSADSYSDWTETYFSTDCLPITLPYSYGFEDVAEEGFPPCWSSYSTIEGYPFVFLETYGAEAHSGTHSLYFYGYGDEYTVMAVLPQIPVDAQHPMSGNEMVFYAAGYYDPTSCQVGIMTDPTDPETFELVETVEIPNAWYSGVGFLRYRVSFDGYTGNGTYIAIRKVKVDGEDAELYVDDIEVRPIYNCSEPTGLTVTATTSSTVTLHWTANNDEIQWQVQYKLYDEEAWPETYQTVNQNPCTLEGLTPGLKYQARVRAVCSDTETSDWTDYAGFITAHAVPYYEDFGSSFEFFHPLIGWQWALGFTLEQILGGSHLEAGNGGGWQTSSLQSVTNPENGMSYSTEAFADTYINMSTDYDWFLSPNIELGEGYQLSFDLALDYNHSATSGLDDNRFAVVISEDGGNSWSLLALWDNDATQGRAYYDIPAILSEVNLDLSAYDNKIVRFAFYAESTVWNSGTNRLMIDNINVTKCIRPEMIVASDITTNSAVLDWTTHGETSWTLQYRIDGLGEWTTVSGITARPYTLEGLVDPNSYQVRVKAHSAAGNSEWSNIAIFATDCAPINLGPNETYEQRFEGRTVPACWQSATTFGNGGWYFNYATYEYDAQGNLIYCAYAHSFNSNTSASLKMPAIEVTSGLCLTFHHSKAVTSATHIQAFVTLPWLENVVLWDSDTDDLSEGITTISLNEYVGQTVSFTFGFSATGSSSFYLYDVKLFNANAFNKNTENGYWNETANWSKGTLPTEEESVAINGAALIPNGYVAQANEITLTSNGSLTIADGGQLKHNNAGVKATAQKSIMPYTIVASNGEDKANGWYLIASPMQEAIMPSETMLSNAFDLYRFNQSAAANDQGITLEWENYKQVGDNYHFNLEPGKGYLYANSGNGNDDHVTLTFTGTPIEGTTYKIPLVKDDAAEFAGWNLVGNPFAQTAYIGNRSFYVMNDDGTEITTSEANSIESMEGIFVIANAYGEELTFSTTRTARQRQQLVINVMHNRGNAIDRAIVRFDEESTLPKLQLNPSHTKVYIPQGGQDFAVVHSEGIGELPINFKAEKNGTYTLSFSNEEVTFSYLHLIDNITGADVDLMQQSNYSFNARTSDNASRFRLVFAADGTSGDTCEPGFAYFNGSSWTISNMGEATLQVVDVMGRVLSSETISGNTEINFNQPTGIYMLRLVNSENVRVQKVVVR